MPGPRDITDVAIDSALHRLPEPQNGWRAHVPPEDLGAMVDSGSGQITLQALVALLWYGNSKERAVSTRTLHRYSEICESRWMLSEPWSSIYAAAIVSCWVAVVVISDRIGDPVLASRYRALLRAWAATCRLMEARVGGGGRVYVMAAGCRCWGHNEASSSLSAMWAWAAGRVEPPSPGTAPYGTPGAYDDWGWIARCARIGLADLRAAASPYPAEMPIEQLLAIAPRWAARTEMQLLGWADGSRLWLMGDDEAEIDDEDANGNTPGWLAAGVLGGRLVALPRWPNPIDGAERLRQTNCRADLDGSPERGWTLWHSHLGDRRGAHPATCAAGFVSTLPAYTAAPLLFWVGILAGDRTWRQLHPRAGTPAPEPPPSRPPQPETQPPGPPPAVPPDFALTTRWSALSREWVLATDASAAIEVVPIWPGPGPDERQRWVARIKRGG